MAQDLDDALRLLSLGRRKHLVVEVRTFVATEEALELDPEDFAEVAAQVGDDIGLGGGGEARDRRRLAAEGFADEARDVEVIGAKVVAPLRQAVGFVEHPGGDLAHADRFDEAAAAELFGRHQHDAGVAEADLVERGAALDRCQQAVDGVRRVDADLHQVVDLILHQRLQRRDDHRELAGAPVVHQRRQLIADGLAAAGGQHGEQTLARQAGGDDRALQRCAVRRLRLRTKGGVTEVQLQQMLGVVLCPAVVAGRVAAVVLAQLRDQQAHQRQRLVDPDRQHRVAAGHANPAQRQGQRETMLGRVREVALGELGEPGRAAARGEAFGGEPASFGALRRCGAAHVAQASSQRRIVRDKEVQQRQPVGVAGLHGGEGLDLVAEQVERDARVLQRIVARVRQQLVALDQPVIRVGRERQRRPFEGVDDRQIQARQLRVLTTQLGKIVAPQVVADEHARAG